MFDLKRIILLLCMWSGLLASQAQLTVMVQDAVNGHGIPYAHIVWQPLIGGDGQMTVTAADGKVVLPISSGDVRHGLVLRVSFVGFNTYTDTIHDLGDRTYQLERGSYDLPEVVITGQYAPTAPERAVHRVKVLDRQQIDRMAANNLGEALRNELNIRLAQDNVLGTSMSMQGMGGENVKILIDGIPVIGRQDGNIDLAQIDLTGIERVEIIEGPLSVNYGTNALAGTINLITRKSGGAPGSLKAAAYAEHIGRLNTTATATRHWGHHGLVITGGRNFFSGWDPSRPGIPSFAPALADTNRYQQWKPREQYFGRLNYRWTGQRWTFGYKGEGMHDVIINKGRPRAPFFETAFDERYTTLRLDNAVFVEGRFNNGKRLNFHAAHDRYGRTRNTWFRDLTTLGEQLAEIEGMQDTTRFTLNNVRAVFSSAPDSSKLAYEAGMDLNLETGTGERIGGGEQEIGDYAVFASLEYRPLEKITIRPGLRAAYNTRYGAPVIPSLNVRWQVNKGFTWRASYAQGFRAPSLKELYFFFVDVNHDIIGNEDLNAERSHNISTALSYRHAKNKGVYKSEITVFHNIIDDLITLALVGGTRYSYVNIGEFRTLGGSIGTSWDNGHYIISLGGAITGRHDELSASLNEGYLFTPEVRGSFTRQWLRKGWSASIFWKYQGEQANYVQVGEDEVMRSTISPFQMADATITKQLWSKRFAITAGCKDLFDVQNVNAALAGGIHSGGGGSIPMTTGRTYFLRLEMDLKKKTQ